MTLDDKIKEAERTLKLGAEMSAYYYHKPLIICYSGGKDSDVMLDIAKRCLKPNEFEVLNNHTTIDAPETVYHIRKVFKELEAEGIKTAVVMPTLYGQPTSMWKLIVKNLTPPTRLNRYCCRFLKEVTVPDRMICFGVREAESTNRKNRDSFEIWAKTKSEAEYRSLGHTYAMFKLDQNGGEDAYQCKMIEQCKKTERPSSIRFIGFRILTFGNISGQRTLKSIHYTLKAFPVSVVLGVLSVAQRIKSNSSTDIRNIVKII